MNSEITQKDRGWLLPAQRKKDFTPGLYLVATPIGNLGDISLRALDVLAHADLIVCEDTRVTGKLLSHYGIKKPLLPYNDHNADRQRGGVIEKLLKGGMAALVSDAGTPLVSDPGYKLVRACTDVGIMVTAIPGASAVPTALQLSGLPSDAFSFIGFLPAKDAARRKTLREWKDVAGSLVAFETGPRLEKSLRAILEVLGDRDIAVARELTKMFEEVRCMKASEAVKYYEDHGAPKGEIVLVIGAGAIAAHGDDEIEAQLKRALKTMGTKEAAEFVAEISGRARKDMYALALGLKK